MERIELLKASAKWMQERGWKQKLAKKRGFEQSLFEHSLIELDVFLELCPILASPSHYGLSDSEQKVLATALVIHDVGKETDAWQTYISDNGPPVPHIIPELTRSVAPKLCAALGLESFEDPIQRIMAHCAEFHHNRPGRSDGAIMEAMLTGGSDRFLTLAQLVKAIDHFCSAASGRAAVDVAKKDPALSQHLVVTSHEITVRGVSTTFVHRAAQAGFQQNGWKPLLYFSDATVYGADPNDYPNSPTTEDISDYLRKEIDGAIARDVSSLMVGSPTGNILPKPDLFSFNEAETKQYLKSAANKINSQSFAKKKLATKRKVVEDYWKIKGFSGSPTDIQVEEEAKKISEAQPEMLVFKFFKAMVDPRKIEVVGSDGATFARKLYEEIFGTGTWRALQSTANLMVAKDMANTVDYFWNLPGSIFGRPQNGTVATIPPQDREAILITVLNGIAQKVYTGRPSPRDSLSQHMAEVFVKDLLSPTGTDDVQVLAQSQLAHYIQSKPFAGKESTKGVFLCPICNAPFDSKSGIKASADFIDNPQTHTNRGVAYGSFGYVMICTTCYYERLLLQILLGSRPAEMITILPRLNLGPGKGEQVVQKVKEWTEAAKGQMRGETGNLEFGFSLGLTDQIARQLGNRDPFTFDSHELLSLFSFRFLPETQKKRRQEALKRLKEEFDDDLNALNVACDQTLQTWEAAVEALIENRFTQQEFRAIRREVFRLYESLDLICQTPNLIFIPLTYEIAAGIDESETSKGLRRLYVALVLSLVFDAAVAIHKEGEAVDFRGGGRTAYVPPLPAIRSLVGYDWLPIKEAGEWLAAIGAASRLVRDTGLPARSALYEVLVADPPEWLAHRIKENWKKQSQRRDLSPQHIRWIETLVSLKNREVIG